MRSSMEIVHHQNGRFCTWLRRLAVFFFGETLMDAFLSVKGAREQKSDP